MSFIRGGETITIKRKSANGSFDEHGLPIETVSHKTIRDCLIAFGSSDEPVVVDGNPERTSLTLYLPPETVIEPGDIFIIRSTEFVKDGSPAEWQSPFDSFPVGVVVPVRRKRG